MKLPPVSFLKKRSVYFAVTGNGIISDILLSLHDKQTLGQLCSLIIYCDFWIEIF